MKVNMPQNEYPPFFIPYLELVEEDLLLELEQQLSSYVAFIRNIPKEKYHYKYAENKWTIQEVVGHNTDTERLKCNCAFRIARGEKAALPGFDEDAYAAATNFNDREMDDLLEEFILVRKNSIAFIRSLNENDYL